MNSKPIDKNLQTFIHGWSGALAGAISTLILYPMENIKTRMQTNEQHLQLFETIKKIQSNEGILQLFIFISDYANFIHISHEYFRSFKIKQSILFVQISAFYKGMTPMLVGNFISYGIYFYWYQLFKEFFKVQPGDNIAYLKVSSLSGIISTIGTNPFWVIQTRSVVGNVNNDSFINIFIQMVQKEGFLSLFKGLTASLILVINPIIQFITYEYFKRKLQDIIQLIFFCIMLKGFISSQFLLYFICGAISKAIATVITFPYQVIRTQTHIEKGKTKKSIKVIINEIFEQQGLKGFFKGLTPKLIQTVLNSAFMLSFYEEIAKIIEFYATRQYSMMERTN